MDQLIARFVRSKATLVNFSMLIFGFGFGQGSLFIGQTWLIIEGQPTLLANFGILFSLFTLGSQSVDSGATVILAQYVAHNAYTQDTALPIWIKYTEITLFRFFVAALSSIILFAFVVLYSAGAFFSSYAICACFGLMAWAFNLSGIIDGIQRSGISGITASIPYVLSAIALVLVPANDLAKSGMVLGAAFSLGYVLTVVIQFIYLMREGFGPRLARPSLAGLRISIRECIGMLLGLIPGQIYFRLQLMICNFALGTLATAVVVYVKQIVSSAVQVTSFVRRTEFASTVTRMAATRERLLFAALATQVASLGLTVVLAIVVELTGLFTYLETSKPIVGFVLLVYAVTILTDSASQCIGQGLVAKKWFYINSFWRIVAMVIAIGVNALSADKLQYLSFVLADVVSHAIFIAAGLVHFRMGSQRTTLQGVV